MDQKTLKEGLQHAKAASSQEMRGELGKSKGEKDDLLRRVGGGPWRRVRGFMLKCKASRKTRRCGQRSNIKHAMNKKKDGNIREFGASTEVKNATLKPCFARRLGSKRRT